MYGLLLALAAAILFGASAPACKLLLQFFNPPQLVGLLYLGAAGAMAPVVVSEQTRFGRTALDQANRFRLAAVVILGGAIGPILLLAALQIAPAGEVSLLLNFEAVATAMLGALLFREHLGGAAWLGMAGVVAAGALLSGAVGGVSWVATLLVVGACTCWGLDNLLSALIDGMTPARTTLWKGVVAGTINLVLGIAAAPIRATAPTVVAALAVGAASYGVSIALHTAAAQRLGAVRAQGVFASAPFIGAALSLVFLGERVTSLQALAAVLFLLSVVALIVSQHLHQHEHGAVHHIHAHTHDDGHHLHAHPVPLAVPHTHWHEHEAVVHTHSHWPDLHHRHPH